MDLFLFESLAQKSQTLQARRCLPATQSSLEEETKNGKGRRSNAGNARHARNTRNATMDARQPQEVVRGAGVQQGLMKGGFD